MQILVRLTEPVMKPLRRLFPVYKIGIDLSPMIAILIIIFLRAALIKTLYRLASSMG